ncbi:terminase small subunit [Candidatus Stoquefichus massiliensis]|uniref:terminase small subunit n=1 Tax=Candidatus Stoquefichus massiliensis TaxID=1470350 RepID=UPI0004B023D2|nr:terminase small subunit [Candidatus Stoquefichus massiliensis]
MTEKEKLCVIEWVKNGFNGTKAYMTVFKKCRKESSAAAAFSRMMNKKDVIEFKEQWLNDIESTEIASANELLMYLTRVVRGQEKDAFGLDASLRDRNDAVEKLLKVKGLYSQKLEVSGQQLVQIVDDIDDS